MARLEDPRIQRRWSRRNALRFSALRLLTACDAERRGWSPPPPYRTLLGDRTLLGGGCKGLMCGRCRSICLEEGADVAHRQRDLVRGVLPRVEADLRVGRQMRALHRHGER